MQKPYTICGVKLCDIPVIGPIISAFFVVCVLILAAAMGVIL